MWRIVPVWLVHMHPPPSFHSSACLWSLWSTNGSRSPFVFLLVLTAIGRWRGTSGDCTSTAGGCEVGIPITLSTYTRWWNAVGILKEEQHNASFDLNVLNFLLLFCSHFMDSWCMNPVVDPNRSQLQAIVSPFSALCLMLLSSHCWAVILGGSPLRASLDFQSIPSNTCALRSDYLCVAGVKRDAQNLCVQPGLCARPGRW